MSESKHIPQVDQNIDEILAAASQFAANNPHLLEQSSDIYGDVRDYSSYDRENERKLFINYGKEAGGNEPLSIKLDIGATESADGSSLPPNKSLVIEDGMFKVSSGGSPDAVLYDRCQGLPEGIGPKRASRLLGYTAMMKTVVVQLLNE